MKQKRAVKPKYLSKKNTGKKVCSSGDEHPPFTQSQNSMFRFFDKIKNPKMPFKRVIVESPFKGRTPFEQRRNIAYARACAHDCLVNHHEAPFLSHLLYTQDGILDDTIPEERQDGIDAGLAWGEVAEATVVYVDFDISKGMEYGIAAAKNASRPVEYRTLGWNFNFNESETNK